MQYFGDIFLINVVRNFTYLHIETFPVSVCGGQHGRLPRARALLRPAPPRHLRQRRHPTGVPHRRAHEVQVRLQVQDRLLGPADSDGAAAGLRLRRVGTGQGHPPFWPHPADPSGRVRKNPGFFF